MVHLGYNKDVVVKEWFENFFQRTVETVNLDPYKNFSDERVTLVQSLLKLTSKYRAAKDLNVTWACVHAWSRSFYLPSYDKLGHIQTLINKLKYEKGLPIFEIENAKG